MEAFLERLGWFCEITRTPICFCEMDGERVLEVRHITGRTAFSADFAEKCVLDFRLQRRDAQSPLVLMFDPGFFIGVAMLRENAYIILGPVASFSMSRDEVQEGCRHILSGQDMPVFCDVLLAGPHLETRKVMMYLALATYLATGKHVSTEHLRLVNESFPRLMVEEPLNASMFETRENEDYHISMEWESRLYSAVELGDTKKLMEVVTGPVLGRAGCMSQNPLNQERYSFISVVTNASRAAVRAGLPQEVSYSLADVYCQQMDKLNNVQNIDMLLMQMLLDYTERVKKARAGSNYSPAIQKCCAYINDHLHEEVALEHLARHCGLSRVTISASFKKETGMPLPDYIHNEKAKEAKYLLRNSEYSISEISSILQYNSQSYFTKVFREKVGCTPQQYRARKGQ